ncbi:hypothetical protein C1H46_007354 [Malus baccata]|uniref:Uncharacterized protein n=1 Tax=Malus baccata TaxID=106549 RepID=A0A540N7C8_MALBA|nr:hypothetical protein C1H46_007354 [Malus baccata]
MADFPLRYLFPLGTNLSASFSSGETKSERRWFVNVQGGVASEVLRLGAGQGLQLRPGSAVLQFSNTETILYH